MTSKPVVQPCINTFTRQHKVTSYKKFFIEIPADLDKLETEEESSTDESEDDEDRCFIDDDDDELSGSEDDYVPEEDSSSDDSRSISSDAPYDISDGSDDEYNLGDICNMPLDRMDNNPRHTAESETKFQSALPPRGHHEPLESVSSVPVRGK
ncbi:hypothetical protein GQ44DRAFT_120783 [Phaeosphaeriaceae sp. PMI808]|nr:hypothetical protein GQ44DRAFT_120783 [Phaeosphaeriaceae sp. PMI808]